LSKDKEIDSTVVQPRPFYSSNRRQDFQKKEKEGISQKGEDLARARTQLKRLC